MTFHALDGHELPRLDALRFEDFAECAFPDLGYEPVLWVAGTVHMAGSPNMSGSMKEG